MTTLRCIRQLLCGDLRFIAPRSRTPQGFVPWVRTPDLIAASGEMGFCTLRIEGRKALWDKLFFDSDGSTFECAAALGN